MLLTLPSLSVQYGIVLDAGSSKTTVYVYQWPAEKENDTGVVSETFKCKVKGKDPAGSGQLIGKRDTGFSETERS